MSLYQIGIGHDVALVSLVAIVPQPRSEGVKPTQRYHAADGSVVDEARYIELEWNSLGSAAKYLALLTQFGLHTALMADVTVYARDETWAFVRWNGIAVRPELGRDARWDIFPRNVTVLVKNLEVAA